VVAQQPDERARARDLGILIGELPPGPLNAITDVAGVRVGQTTLIEGEGPLVVGRGPVRTGVTVILPRPGDVGADPVFAGHHVLNGNGEMTGAALGRGVGAADDPGRDHEHPQRRRRAGRVDRLRGGARAPPGGGGRLEPAGRAETYDGFLNDINGLHVRPEHVVAALDGGRIGAGRRGGASAAAPA
jgi:D-aminopeptidase